MGSNGSLGAVRVANEVIASIAALAACEMEGVSGMDEHSARHFGDSEGKLAEVASAVQGNVVEATERMLGLEVGEVNVFVSSIAFSN